VCCLGLVKKRQTRKEEIQCLVISVAELIMLDRVLTSKRRGEIKRTSLLADESTKRRLPLVVFQNVSIKRRAIA